MYKTILSLFLPIIFVLHNYEEFRGFGRFKEVYSKFAAGCFGNQDVFKYAIIFLSTIVVIAVGGNYLFDTYFTRFACLVVVFAIFINAVQHILLSVRYRKILPGTYTSFFLIIPYFVILILTAGIDVMLFKQHFFKVLFFSVIVMLLSVYLSLVLGYIFKIYVTKKRR